MGYSSLAFWQNPLPLLYSLAMNQFLTFMFIVLALPLLIGCSSDREEYSPLTPAPETKRDPDDEMIRPAVAAFVKSAGAPAASSYDFRRIDLNYDGRRDALVILKSPYGHWCENNGCTMLVLRAGSTDFTTIGTIAPIREPIFVSGAATNGWRDLIVRVSGRLNETAKNVALKYNGRAYPKTPSGQPTLLRFHPSAHTNLFRESGR